MGKSSLVLVKWRIRGGLEIRSAEIELLVR